MEDDLRRRRWIEVGGIDRRQAALPEQELHESQALIVGEKEIRLKVGGGGVEDLRFILSNIRAQVQQVLVGGISSPPLPLRQSGVALDQSRDRGAALRVLLASFIAVTEAVLQVVV